MSDSERDNDIESDADKRAHHNALERKRRDHIKDSFRNLREALPNIKGEKVSRTQILWKAAEFIAKTQKKNLAIKQDIDDLERENQILEEKIRELEKAKGIVSYPASLYDLGSGSESSDTDESKGSRRKKLKTRRNDART